MISNTLYLFKRLILGPTLLNRGLRLARLALISSTLGLLGGHFATADSLEIPVGQQMPDKSAIDRPIKGMNKLQVEAVFGQPLEQKGATGEPPISSWIYEEFVVYFEYDYVIHTVLKHIPVANQTPQP